MWTPIQDRPIDRSIDRSIDLPEILGAREIVAGWRVEGKPSLEEVLALIPRLIRFVGMEPYEPPYVLSFPTPEGKGGAGYQIYQALVESWLVIGTWPECGFCRVVLSSCKGFNPNAVTSWLSKEFGMVEKEIWGEL